MADTDDFSRAVARVFRDAFEQSNYSVRGLAESANMSPTTLQAYLSGKTVLPITKAHTLAGLLGRDFKRIIEQAEMSL